MRKLLVFQHVPYEILGIFNPLLKQSGFRIRYINYGRDPEARPNLSHYNGLVILGGPMNVDQTDRYPHLQIEVELIQEAIKSEMPVLGICLGAQLIAKALGAQVGKNPTKEIGWYDITPTDAGLEDPLFKHFKTTRTIFQWHGDTFELPDEAVLLASSPTCPNQAFRFGDHIYGFQFHLEVDQGLVHNWLDRPAYREEIKNLGGSISPDTIREETAQYIQQANELGEDVFKSFIEILGFVKKFKSIGSK